MWWSRNRFLRLQFVLALSCVEALAENCSENFTRIRDADLPEPISYVSGMATMTTRLTPRHPLRHFEDPLTTRTCVEQQILCQ